MDKNKALQSKRDYDILNMLNSISNFEIFTPFEVAQNMVNLLPEEAFKDPSYKFLDPCVKSGIFLREIIYKLNDNLPRIKYTDIDSGTTYDLSNKKERISHILRNMIYGIAISELTAYVTRRTIYGVMDANVDKESEFLDSKLLSSKKDINTDDLYFNDYYDHTIFNTEDRKGYEKEGNIFYPCEETNIENEDTHHPFINETEHKFINFIKEGKVKFNVVIGNPPYQINKGGNNVLPLYHLFVNNAIKINPKYISMIIPSRWQFETSSTRKEIINFRSDFTKNGNVKYIYNFYNSQECFSNVSIEGGVNYFLWDRDYKGTTKYTEIKGLSEKTFENNLSFFDTIITENIVYEILKKINRFEIESLSKNVSQQEPFAPAKNKFFNTSESDDSNGVIKFYGNKDKFKDSDGIGYIKENKITRNKDLISKHKVLTSKANGGALKSRLIISPPIYSEPNSVCSETYLVINSFKNKEKAFNFIKYMKTKFFRFLLAIRKKTQNTTSETYKFIPNLDMDEEWNDEKLYKHFNLSKEEIEYIEKTIKPME